ncbi:MAG TPA: DNA repair protein RadA, partial [Thermodesulfobacteriota bacterium]|nr:DNA repair protein RadA [Thermodesulfobacteriota bacterium]
MRARTVYRCQACGHPSVRWAGRCAGCGAWNTLVEELEARPARAAGRPGAAPLVAGAPPVPISAVVGEEAPRLVTGIAEFDRVLGGGLVPGCAVLVGGDPGIGKSTLLLQAAGRLCAAGARVLYVSGEESVRQITLRARRLGVSANELLVYAETRLEAVEREIERHRPAVVVVDSIQTLATEALESAPGSIAQVRESAARLVRLAKGGGPAVFLVGHVTKDGAIAGPRVVEHIVDTVLYFEGERGYPYRVLRAVKNRFGSTDELGVFEMKEGGLAEVGNPSEFFLAERLTQAPGSAVVASLEGSRPILVELQALVGQAAYGTPRRTAIGVDVTRVALLAAVLEKTTGLSLAALDVFVKVAGGIRLGEPAIDLGLVAALASSARGRPLPPDTVVFGEVGLGGEVRAVAQPEPRLREAARLGFARAVLPR